MAINVLVVPEDFRKDQYVLKPIVEKMLSSLGVNARVKVCRDPLLGGVGEALKRERVKEILERYRGMIRVFLLIVDRDCIDSRRSKLDSIETYAAEQLQGSSSVFLAHEAYQEVEVWVLAGLKPLPKKWIWKNLRAHCDPKEEYFDELVKERNLTQAPYGGRDELAREAAANYQRIRQLCPEVEALEIRIFSALEVAP